MHFIEKKNYKVKASAKYSWMKSKIQALIKIIKGCNSYLHCIHIASVRFVCVQT